MVSLIADLIMFLPFFGFSWSIPFDLFFFRLVNTHDYIMCYLIFVLTLVSWLLYIIIKNFFWGVSSISVTSLNSIFYYICGVFNEELFFWGLKYWVLVPFFFFADFFVYWLNFLFFLFFLRRSNKILNDTKILVHFIIKRKFKKLRSRIVFFFAGPRCFIRGYFFDPMDIFLRYEFLSLRDFGRVEYVSICEAQEDFINSRIVAPAFFNTDGIERFYSLQKWRHSFFLELFWAIAPSIIIMLILGPSLVLLYSSGSLKHSDFNVAVNASQWYWNYSSSAFGASNFQNSCLVIHTKCRLLLPLYIGNFYMDYFYKVINFKHAYIFFDTYNEFDSYMLELDDNSKKGIFKRLLDTTQHVKAPAIMVVRFVISSNDVLHSFALLSLGVKVDAVTGRINELVVFLGKEGLLYGQCSELCGAGHYGMPIVLESLSDVVFENSLLGDFWQGAVNDLTNCPLNFLNLSYPKEDCLQNYIQNKIINKAFSKGSVKKGLLNALMDDLRDDFDIEVQVGKGGASEVQVSEEELNGEHIKVCDIPLNPSITNRFISFESPKYKVLFDMMHEFDRRIKEDFNRKEFLKLILEDKNFEEKVRKKPQAPEFCIGEDEIFDPHLYCEKLTWGYELVHVQAFRNIIFEELNKIESIFISKLKLNERFSATDIVRMVNLYKGFKIYSNMLNNLSLQHPTRRDIISNMVLKVDVVFATKVVLFSWAETPGIPYWVNHIVPIDNEVKVKMNSSVYGLEKLDSWYYDDHLIMVTYHSEPLH